MSFVFARAEGWLRQGTRVTIESALVGIAVSE